MKKNDFGKFRKRDGIRREKRNDEKFKELTGRERDWSSYRRREKRRLQDFGGFVTYRDILEFFKVSFPLYLSGYFHDFGVIN